MSNKEKNLSDYIDSLNKEHQPKEHATGFDSSEELEKLCTTARLVRSLKEPDMPEENYPQKLAKAVESQLSQKTVAKKRKKSLFAGFAAVAAALIMVITFNNLLSFRNANIVYAMNEAFQEVKAYHGFLEVIEITAKGESTTQAKLEVWANKEGHYYIKELEGFNKGLTTYNNGIKKWQIRPEHNEIHVFPAFPDLYIFTFELGKEVKGVSDAQTTRVVKEDVVAGRQCSLIEVSPKGGASYQIWIDKNTKLPLQKQYAMQNALQYKVTYTKIDFIDAIPAEIMAYSVPKGFKEIKTSPEQIVNNLEETTEIAGFTPKTIETIPNSFVKDIIAVDTDKKIVKQYYTTQNKEKKVVILQGKSFGEFKTSPNAILGKIDGSVVEIMSPVEGSLGIIGSGGTYSGVTNIRSIRWQRLGFEYAVVGNASLEELTSFIKNLTSESVEIPSLEDQITTNPQIKVPVDLNIEENEQKSVDAGHSPWRLDPAFVAQVFVSLKISPGGITGEYPVKYEDVKVLQNTGKIAIVEVKGGKTPIKNVYLKRLIRQDSTGIWTVVAYDPIEIKQ
jgi:outer membrane lipoprotein-sorting protein